jgi:integrase/recombinase XerD
MRERETPPTFRSPLATLMSDFIREKQSLGYKYEIGIHALRRLDRFLCRMQRTATALPREVVEHWIAPRPHEQPGTRKLRLTLVRQFALYLHRRGHEAFVPEGTERRVHTQGFTPYIFSHRQIKSLLQAADQLPPDKRCPLRHFIMPEMFRLLYGCGMRVGEVTHLTVADVDLVAGIMTVREGKFHKDRLVPMAPSLTARLREYSRTLGARNPTAWFFPAPDGGPYSNETVYGIFRRLLRECAIPHRGRGKGPRLHDIRHGFAVHRLQAWYREGVDLGAKLPILAAYMGHRSLLSTQHYLRITPEIFPEINARLDRHLGHIIPRREGREEV